MTCRFIFLILIWVSFISGPKYNIDLSLKSFTFMSVYIALFSGWWIVWIEYLAASCAEGSWQMQLEVARYTLKSLDLFASRSRPLLAWHLHIRTGIKRHSEQARMVPARDTFRGATKLFQQFIMLLNHMSTFCTHPPLTDWCTFYL